MADDRDEGKSRKEDRSAQGAILVPIMHLSYHQHAAGPGAAVTTGRELRTENCAGGLIRSRAALDRHLPHERGGDVS